MSTPRLAALVIVGALSAAACSATAASEDAPALEGLGRIPGASSVTSVPVASSMEGPIIGSLARGNKLLVIGDSIFAATAKRYGGAMCAALVPLGWRTAVEAETSRRIVFGRRVLDARLREGWDAAVVFLGTNYGGDAAAYERELAWIVDALAPAPVLLLTPTVYRSSMTEVAARIRAVASSRPSVAVLDWATISRRPGVLSSDGIHPSASGREALAAAVAAAVGSAPSGTGNCLSARFTDDSSATPGAIPATTVPSSSSSSTSSSSSSSSVPSGG